MSKVVKLKQAFIWYCPDCGELNQEGGDCGSSVRCDYCREEFDVAEDGE